MTTLTKNEDGTVTLAAPALGVSVIPRIQRHSRG